ncbi:MAG TPA: hypothetical protein VMT54_20185 [Candidatus Cybelea sp.]|nr:hypothetical protein [Candidatus Cybelea sp.]
MSRFGAMVLSAILAATAAPASAGDPVKDIAFPGGSERALLITPGQPKATLILFPGGDGVIGLGSDGSIATGSNFLVRSRRHWGELGFAVLLPDVPSGQSGLMGQRLTDSYAAAVSALVGFAKQQSAAPVWLIGTSQGTNAVVNAASRMTHREIAGIVLTSTLTEPGTGSMLRETVFGAKLAAIDVPVLIVSHSEDACKLSPPTDDARVKAALTGAPQAEITTESGGKPADSDACGAKSAHGFYGIEGETIRQIADWIAAH